MVLVCGLGYPPRVPVGAHPSGSRPGPATGFCGDTREYSTAADSVARVVTVWRACDCVGRPTSVAGFGRWRGSAGFWFVDAPTATRGSVAAVTAGTASRGAWSRWEPCHPNVLGKP